MKHTAQLKTIQGGLILIVAVLFTFLSGCKDDDASPDPDIGDNGNGASTYFPPKNASSWRTVSTDSLGWRQEKLDSLKAFVESANTRAFIVLTDGKLAIEWYFGKELLGGDFNQSSNWYWASAAKTLTATLIGQLENEGKLNLTDPTSDYLGEGWTNLDSKQESEISVWHQLTMTSGLDDSDDPYCTDPECLTYQADPGERWAYHNAPYTLLDSVIQVASGSSFDDYFNSRIRDAIGMDGFWAYQGYNHLYFSTARSMARFGWLVMNDGVWEQDSIIPQSFVEEMTSTSQELNPSYGYLWWLNGKDSHRLPAWPFSINGEITPNAPADMVAAMGKNGQLINVVPSLNIVVVRMGDNPDNSLVPSKFQDELWEHLNQVLVD